MPLALAFLFAAQAALPLQGPTQAGADAQLTQAEARYRAAIAATPAMSAYHESLALVLERQGRAEEALSAHRNAVRLDSLSGRNRAGLGLLLLRMGQTPEAISHLQAAAAIDPTSVEVQRQLAIALLQQGRGNEAIVALREARRLDSTDHTVDSLLASSQAALDAEQGYHDYSGFADEQGANRRVRQALEIVFAVLLGLCAFALVPPLVSGLVLALVQSPRQWIRRVVSR